MGQLTNLAKKAKKNNVAIDIINIGVYENIDRLKAFIESVNNADNSHLVHVDLGAGSVADMVISSPINTVAAANNNAGAIGGDVGNVDPNLDPELAEAIRQSLEEQKQMLQGTEVKREESKMEDGKEMHDAPQENIENDDEMTEEERLQRAIMLSLEGRNDEHAEAPTETVEVNRTEEKTEKKEEEKKVDLEEELLKDQDFISELIEGISGITEYEKEKVISSMDKKEDKTEAKEEDRTETKKEEKKEEAEK